MTRGLLKAGFYVTGYIGGAATGWGLLVLHDFWRLAHRKSIRTPHLITRSITWP